VSTVAAAGVFHVFSNICSLLKALKTRNFAFEAAIWAFSGTYAEFCSLFHQKQWHKIH